MERERLQHLLQSDYIRSFDEVDPTTKEYKRDIKEADAEHIMAELESRGLVVIQVDRMLDKYEAEALSECYKKQLERGIIVLEKGASILFVDEAELLTEAE